MSGNQRFPPVFFVIFPSMLKFFRVLIALVIFVCLSLFFLDFTEAVPLSFHRLAHIQIVPLIQTKHVLLLLLLFGLTIVFGRFYCSVICPWGIFQDSVSKTAAIIRSRKGRYQFRPAMHKTRLFFLLLFIAGLVAMPVTVSLLDPYSNFGRLLTLIGRPIYLIGNNYLAQWNPDAFFAATVPIAPLPAVLFTLAVTIFVGVLSFLFGRRFCNTVCPIGTLLGLLAKIAPFRIRLNTHVCTSCGLCEKVCKGECIDSKAKTVDNSRCVDCFNCIGACRKKGVTFSKRGDAPILQPEKTAASNVPVMLAVNNASLSPRRSFLQGVTALLLFRSSARAAALPSGLPTGQSRVAYKRKFPVIPPGAKNKRRLIHHCTACQLCVAKCPANVIQPSITDLGLQGFLVPVMNFDYGFCRYNCTICTEVCPTAALIPIPTVEDKHLLQLGCVTFIEENCVVVTQKTNCGACAEHCPTGAIQMRPFGHPGSALTLPKIDVDLCVGCGACEHICPVQPYRAIYVEGLEEHGQAKPAYDPNEKQQEIQLDSFGF